MRPVVTGRLILVADEDADTRIILRTVLERHDYSIVDAGTADAAAAEARRVSFDLVILNYPMVCGNGESLVHRLRSTRETHDVPILNLTSRVVPQFLEEAAREGVTVTLAKPIDVEDVLSLVTQLTVRSFVSAS
jgi:two-component system, sensor histidine kinase